MLSDGAAERETDRARGESQNVEAVLRCFEALNERDIDGYIACCTDDFQLFAAVAPVEGAYVGADGIRRFFRDIVDAAPDFRLVSERLEAVDPDCVLGFERMTWTGRLSSIDFGALPIASVYDLAGGKLKRIRAFLDRQEALAAVGLPE